MTDQEPGPGRRLREERERLGITVREVAEHLNLSTTVLHAIEAEDYSRLPGPVFVRGYLRAYARLLQLDPGPLLARCPYGAADAGPASQPAGPSLREWVRRRPVLILSGGAVLLTAALAAVLVAVWPQDGEDVESVAQAAFGEAATSSEAVGAEFVKPAGMAERPISEVDVAAPVDGLAAVDPAPVVASVPDVTAETAGPAGETRRISPEGEDRIELTFSEDCWVEIRDLAGVNRYSGLGRAGSELVLEGEGPLRVLLGFAPGVTLAFNGEPVPLQPHTRNNVATLVLGQ